MEPEVVKTLMWGAFMIYAARELGSIAGKATSDLKWEYYERKANGNGNGNGTSKANGNGNGNGNGKRNRNPKA